MTEEAPVRSVYEIMKDAGVNLSWYERRKHRKPGSEIPLEDDRCSQSSIYLLKQDGSLWTVRSSGEPFAEVRRTEKRLPRATFLCLHCKQQWTAMPTEHK